MITPGFFNFYNAHRSFIAAQAALSTITNNVANVNTPGYTRQRVETSAFFAYQSPMLSADLGHGQLGQGPNVDGVIRVREAFMDEQFRFENGILGTNEEMRSALQRIEGILAEPATTGINDAMQNFFDAAQELSLNPENIAVRQNFVEYANDLVVVFQQQATQLAALQRSLVGDPAVPASLPLSRLAMDVRDVNDKLAEIASINREILTVVSANGQPNDLYDRRDLLLDELSHLVDVQVTQQPSGQVDVTIGGQLMVDDIRLVDTFEVIVNPLGAPATDTEPSVIQTVNGLVNMNTLITSGQVRGVLDAGGMAVNRTTVRSTLEDLNTLLLNVATEVNTLQANGIDGTPPAGLIPVDPIFDIPAPGPTLEIFGIQVNANVRANPLLVAAAPNVPATQAGLGDGRNALAMAQLRDASLAALGGAQVSEYFNGVLADLGIDTRTFENRMASQGKVVETLDFRRQEVSGVNIDEEMIDMLRFQRQFEATGKVLQVYDEILQTIINLT